MTSRIRGTLLLIAIVVAAPSGFYAGARIASTVTAPETELIAIGDPGLATAIPAWAQRSAGGFTGFGGLPALSGQVLRSGTVTETSDGMIVVTGADNETVIVYSEPVRLYRIQPAASALRSGDAVTVRMVEGAVTGVLRLNLDPPAEPVEPSEPSEPSGEATPAASVETAEDGE